MSPIFRQQHKHQRLHCNTDTGNNKSIYAIPFFVSLVWISCFVGTVMCKNEIQIVPGSNRFDNVKTTTAGTSVQARISIDSLFNMTSFKFRSFEDQSAIFSMSKILYRKVEQKNRPEVMWHGMMKGMNRTGFCTLLESSDGKIIAAAMSTETAAYEIIYSSQQLGPQIRWTSWGDFPPDDDDDDDDNNDNRHMNEIVEDTTKENTMSLLRSKKVDENFMEQHFQRNGEWVVASTANSDEDSFDRYSSKRDPPRQLQSKIVVADPVIDILVLITDKARCEYAGFTTSRCSANEKSILDRIPIMEAETNAAMSNSKVNATIRIVGTVLLSRLSEMENHTASSEALQSLQSSTYVTTLRATYGADLVSMITARGGVCGHGYVHGVYSVVSNSCLGQYSFSHEIGHNLGCRHDRANCDSSHAYAHGYQYNGKFRTVMAYPCSGGSCPRLLYYSSINVRYKGSPIGAINNDNARMIREQAQTVALKNSPPSTTCPVDNKKPCTVGFNRIYKYRLLLLFRCQSKCVAEASVGQELQFGWKCGNCP
jgi:Metallo-peptidase family M12B Reprolysin-like